MRAVIAERQCMNRNDGLQRQRAIEMREQRAGPRGLPLPGVERTLRHHDQQHIRFAGTMTPRAFDNLFRCREMEKAVAAIVGRAMIAAGLFSPVPFCTAREMVEKAAHSRSFSIATSGISAGGN